MSMHKFQNLGPPLKLLGQVWIFRILATRSYREIIPRDLKQLLVNCGHLLIPSSRLGSLNLTISILIYGLLRAGGPRMVFLEMAQQHTWNAFWVTLLSQVHASDSYCNKRGEARTHLGIWTTLGQMCTLNWNSSWETSEQPSFWYSCQLLIRLTGSRNLVVSVNRPATLRNILLSPLSRCLLWDQIHSTFTCF